MTNRSARPAAWLAVFALLVNLAGHVSYGSGLAAVEPHQSGAVLVICTPDGMKRMLWTADGFEPLPDEPGQVKKPCPFCSLVAGGLLLPEAPPVSAPLQVASFAVAFGGNLPICCLAAAEIPPARAPPLSA